ncbi:MAG: hypothetical protein HY695_36015 [Deltaproteobacteria bacterium]|nr:hypothetical protein [Deltaproteobacteria bacterium]
MATCMNNYVLRIYRLDRKKPQSLVGIAEEVGVKRKSAFTSIQELWDILSHPRRRPVEREKKNEEEKRS